jgi:D-serine deaminase-like pyridoxal phosphate-dependent protein
VDERSEVKANFSAARFSIAFVFAATACAVKTEKAADTLAVASSTSTSTPDMTVTENGIGPIHAGMTVAQANAAIGGGFAAPKGGTSGCTYAVLTKAPRGLWVMLQDGRVARVEVRSGSIATSTGARIGDSEARIKQLYPGVATTPHKYVAGGHYLTVTGSDPANRIVFETDGSKVTTFRSGRTPEVENVEGCG